ncbi:MAG: acetate--CoA ligase family protein, partial [Xanthobacteraceae bacterium]|nr:acetate--CoA ligase family protein [Xanthobacteraceae bacterium]
MPPNSVTGKAPVRHAALGARSLREVLFAPRAIALVGQSNDAGKTAGRPLKFLRQAGYAGRVYPVNARRDEVLGERAWPSLESLPEVPEHAYIVAPTEAAMDAIEACGRAGVAVATVLSDGFAEAGDLGLARENRLTEIVRATGMRIVGPSSLGIVDLRSGALITANAAFDEPGLPVGRIFGASHSGGMIGTFLSRGRACGIGFAGLVSVGNEVDLSLGEICLATLEDPDIDGYLLFLETLRHADTLRRFAVAAAAAGKPVLAYKLGRSAAARELALTHTGALAGEDDIADAFLRDCGIARVESLSGLLEGLPLLGCVPPRRGAGKPRVAVITTTAGGAATVIDPLASRGIEVGPPSEDTYARFAAAGIKVARARLVDLTLVGTRYEVMKAALDILTTAPEFDLVVTVVGSSARFYPQLAVRPIVESAGAPKAIAAFLVPEAPQARAELAKAGIANFYTPEACADAVAAALARRPPRVIPTAVREPHIIRRGAPARMDAGRTLDELEAYSVLESLGVPRAPSVALEIAAEVPALPFAYPVAAKILSAEITHKSDVGGVALGLADAAALAATLAEMRERLPQAKRVLVQPMIAGLGEVLVGYRVDADAGPMVMLAAGGIYTEIYRDRSLRLAPVDLATAREMIAEVR